MKFAKNLSAAQMAEARALEAAGITTISQAVKAFQERPAKLAEYRAALESLRERRESNQAGVVLP